LQQGRTWAHHTKAVSFTIYFRAVLLSQIFTTSPLRLVGINVATSRHISNINRRLAVQPSSTRQVAYCDYSELLSRMDVISEVLHLVERSTRLSLLLYEFAQRFQSSTKDVNKIASGITVFSVTLKQVAGNLAESDKIASQESVETLQEILRQCRSLFAEVERIVPLKNIHDHPDNAYYPTSGFQPWKPDLAAQARLDYLLAHLDSLQMTLAVMMQTFSTVSMMSWIR
jgi:hypothetical protein